LIRRDQVINLFYGLEMFDPQMSDRKIAVPDLKRPTIKINNIKDGLFSLAITVAAFRMRVRS
jgi:hypothetical protein